MSFIKIIISYLLTMVVFFAVDMVWLGLVAKNIYAKYLGHYLSDQVNWPAAMLFYLLYIAGILVFVVFPAVGKNSMLQAIAYGAFFGLVAYATYDLTNYATLKDWPFFIVVVDLLWGMVLTSVVSLAGFYIVRYIQNY